MSKVLGITWKHIRRSPYQALAAMMIMVLTFFVISVFALLSFGSERIINYFETRPQITAFLKDEISEEKVDLLKKQLLDSGQVANLKYVSKEEALAIYREQNKEDPLLLEMVTAEILPASLEVSALASDDLAELAKTLENASGVEEVLFQADVVAALNNWTRIIRRAGLGLVAFFVLTSLLVVLIIISMKIAAKKIEIEILKLLGASRGYIHNPFLIEGIIYGLAGALIGWGLAYLVLLYATPFLVAFFGEISLLPIPFWLMLALLAAEIGLGVFIGSLASFLAVRRYLRLR